MTYSRTKGSRGFTLVETLTYSAGLVIILGGIVACIVYMYKWYRSATIPTRVDTSALALMAQIVGDIRAGNTPNDSLSIYGVPNGVLAVTRSNGANSTTTTYTLDNGRMASKVNSAATTTISAGDIWISGFQANKLTTTNSTAIKVQLSIDYSSDGATSTRTYSNLAIMRQSY